jgi:hypothetical protein
MKDDSTSESLADEEAAFWRGFIEGWARERDGCVPPRAWEALSAAEAKAKPCDDSPASRIP